MMLMINFVQGKKNRRWMVILVHLRKERILSEITFSNPICLLVVCVLKDFPNNRLQRIVFLNSCSVKNGIKSQTIFLP
jgi:hypothetical protein